MNYIFHGQINPKCGKSHQSHQVALSRMDSGRGLRAEDIEARIEATPSNRSYGKVCEHTIQALRAIAGSGFNVSFNVFCS